MTYLVNIIIADYSMFGHNLSPHSLQNQLNAESGDILFFCCPTLSSGILLVTQADFNACNTTATSLAKSGIVTHYYS